MRKKNTATKSKASNKATSTGKRLFVAFAALALFAILGLNYKGTSGPNVSSNDELASRSVKIVRNDGRSGGTGSILRSYASESEILTNSHVCEVIENGGMVITEKSTHRVTSYYQSNAHDLCIVKVAANLGMDTPVAQKAPESYTQATVSGHPRLLPNVVTKGHFSGRESIEILTKIRPCTADDMNGADVVLCAAIGGIPVITRYEAQLVTALIQPGSSGSAVFNDEGEISAVVFAGAGGLSYAFTVPYEQVANFVFRESVLADFKKPNDTYEINMDYILGGGQRSFDQTSTEFKLDKACSDMSLVMQNKTIAKACQLRGTNLIWTR